MALSLVIKDKLALLLDNWKNVRLKQLRRCFLNRQRLQQGKGQSTRPFSDQTRSHVSKPPKKKETSGKRERERENKTDSNEETHSRPNGLPCFGLGRLNRVALSSLLHSVSFQLQREGKENEGDSDELFFFALSVYGADQMRNRKALSYKANGRKRKTGSLYFVIAIYDGLLLETCPQAISTHLYISMGFRLDVCLILWRVHFQNWAATRALHFRYRFEEGQQHNWML